MLKNTQFLYRNKKKTDHCQLNPSLNFFCSVASPTTNLTGSKKDPAKGSPALQSPEPSCSSSKSTKGNNEKDTEKVSIKLRQCRRKAESKPWFELIQWAYYQAQTESQDQEGALFSMSP